MCELLLDKKFTRTGAGRARNERKYTRCIERFHILSDAGPFFAEMQTQKPAMKLKPFYPLFEEKVGIVLLSGLEVGLESELPRRFEVP